MNNQKYQQLKKIATKICKNDENTDDLLHDILIQLETNKTYNTLSDNERVYFFIRAIQNQYYSNNSHYHKTYRKYAFDDIPINYEVEEQEYKELPTIDWVKETLDKELEVNKEFWYKHGIYTMYLQERKLEVIHRKTRIPKYSLRQTLQEMKLWLNKKWIEHEK
jgi:hypothetical protein